MNLAVQDAVATANILAGALLEYQRSGKPVEDRLLAAIRKRRWMPTIVTQAIQRALHRVAVPRALRGEKVLGPHPGTVFKWVPGLQRLNSRLTGVGPRPGARTDPADRDSPQRDEPERLRRADRVRRRGADHLSAPLSRRPPQWAAEAARTSSSVIPMK